MRGYEDPWWESCDEDGNPEISGASPKEEPDCPPCGDSGKVRTWFGVRRCPSCDPDRLDLLRAAVRCRLRRLRQQLTRRTRTARSPFDNAPPF